MKQPLLLLLLLFYVAAGLAREPQLYFEKLTTQNGLSHNKVNCILEDQRGFLWIGTDDGLNRYDGKNFVRFRHRPSDSSSVSGNMITDLVEDGKGVLWIATADGGLSRYDFRLPPQQQFRQYRHRPGKKGGIPVNIINSLLEDAAGYLWLATSGHSVLRFDKEKEKFMEVVPAGTRTVLTLSFDHQGMICAGRQGGGLLKIDPRTLTYQEDPRYRDLYAKLPHASITAIYRDRRKNLWLGSWDKVLYRQTANADGEDVFAPASRYSFTADEIISFAEDGQGWLWMGGKEKGLQLFDPQTAKFYNYRHDPSKDGSVADNRINCIFTDRQGRMWLGTNRGLSVSNAGKQQFRQVFLSSERSSPLTLYDFHEEGDELWIGTSEGLLIRKPDGRLIQERLQYKGAPLHVTCFFRDGDGSIYLGTDYSLFRYFPAGRQLELLPNTEKDGVMKRIIDSRVVSMVKDEIEGHPVLLTAPYGHFLAYYDLERRSWVSRLDSTRNIIKNFNLQDNLIRKFFKSSNGNIWMATAKAGLAKWIRGQKPRAVFFAHSSSAGAPISNNVYDLAEDRKGNLWISTFGGGLHYFNTAREEFTQIEGSSNLIEGLQLDGQGNVWMICNGHLQRYDPEKKSFTRYDLPDLEKTGGVSGRIFRDRKGFLYAAGANYFISFHPDSVTETRIPPRVFFTDFSIFNASASHLLQQEKIRLSFRQNYFTIEFAAPDFTPGSEVHYAYQLQGFDPDWIEAGNQNRVSYSNLDGGTYTFRVKASNSPGVWSSDMAEMTIRIVPPFWKRPWFYALGALLLAALAYGLYRYRINELLKRQSIRNKIAQDLHDNVGSTLSSISVYSQVARIYHQQHKEEDLQTTLEKISDTSGEMISELNDTVWAINPRNDNMEVILQRMDSFARPLLTSQGIQFRFTYGKEIRYLNLDMEKRKNFYLIFKEVVNNTLKYSGSKNFSLHIQQKGNFLHASLKDNGRGFDLARTSEGYKSSDVYGGGNGLKNMQLRAREMKGTVQIESAPGSGTTVLLQFPIT